MKRFHYAILMLALFTLVVGCSNSPTTPKTSQTDSGTLNLEEEFGGYTTAEETPAFGDVALEAEGAGEVAVDDPIASEPVLDSIVRDSLAGCYHLRVIWGNIPRDTSDNSSTDWKGSLSISRGGMIVRRLIRFEPATDYLIPRTDRRLIEWESQTYGANDGIAVDMFIPRPKPVVDTTIIPVMDSLGNSYDSLVINITYPAVDPVDITFASGPYTSTFSLRELAGLDTIISLPDGNEISFVGFKKERLFCPRGFLAGRWGFDSTGQGVFRGYWMSFPGHIDGHVTGHYGTDSSGQNVFFGKWISTGGRFEGFLRGTYVTRPVSTAAGVVGMFDGAILDASSAPVGRVHGQFRARPGVREGFFQGRWKLRCFGQNGLGDEPGGGDNPGGDESGDGF